MWLAGGAPMPQVRAIASGTLASIEENTGRVFSASPSADDQMAAGLMARDIKRFLERPMEPIRTPTTYDAPPGAPIGEGPLDWLASPPWTIR